MDLNSCSHPAPSGAHFRSIQNIFLHLSPVQTLHVLLITAFQQRDLFADLSSGVVSGDSLPEPDLCLPPTVFK